jgi:hypothetical protein
MNGILDTSFVGIALVLSAGYALLALGPRALRLRLSAALHRAAGRAPTFLGVRRGLERLVAAVAGKAGACGGCEDCGTGQTAGKSADSEVRVPVTKIGMRR